jgi:hypothetical protein
MKTFPSTSTIDSASVPAAFLRRRWPLLVALGVVLGLVFWWWQPVDYSNDPQLVDIRQLQEKAQGRFAENGGPITLAEAKEYVATVEAIRQRVEALPSHLRRAAFAGGQNFFFSSMRQRLDDYYSAPPSQRQQVLDRQIRQSDLMRKAFEEAREARQAAVVASGGPQQQGGQRRGPPWANRSQDERNEWFRDQILNRTSPEQRAKYVEYRRAASVRREQLGLPEGWP